MFAAIRRASNFPSSGKRPPLLRSFWHADCVVTMADDLLERSNALLFIGIFRLFARCGLFYLFEQTFPTLQPKYSIIGGRKCARSIGRVKAPAAWRYWPRSAALTAGTTKHADCSSTDHTNSPSVPGQRETNDTGLAATSKVDNHNGA
jgi:hypothetical protein